MTVVLTAFSSVYFIGDMQSGKADTRPESNFAS